jgi:serine phosphatase RsbU (regulator of sigma subunit)
MSATSASSPPGKAGGARGPGPHVVAAKPLPDTWRDVVPDVATPPRSERGWRHRHFVSAFVRALGDRSTYDPRRNIGLWLGFLLALPIPILALSSTGPRWIDVVALTAPLVWAAIVGAARRVALVESHRGDALTLEASRVHGANAAEHVLLRGAAHLERLRRERAELIQDRADVEMALAQRVNHSLLPPDMSHPDLEVVVRQIPFAYVGGDYLHVARPRPDLLYLCVGDVAGHGVSAALVVSRIHGLMQRLVIELSTPEQILEHLNRATTAVLEHTPLFMTFAVLRVDLSARLIDYATAGHPAQLLLRRDGKLEQLSTANGFLGVANPEVLGPTHRASVPYGLGDTLILFTDGLFEVAARDGGAMLGESGLLSGLDQLSARPPDEIASEILRRVTEFGHLGPFADDVSLMVARLGPAAGTSPRTD